jgi:pimeloyl-ACP methyl ester carboxylesterase
MDGTVVDTLRLERRWKRLDLPTIERTRPGVRVVDLPATRIRVRVDGSGPRTLLFVCDPPNVVEQYDEIIARLGARHRVAVMEQPGMGFSFPKAGFGFTLRDYTDAMVALLESLDLAPYVLVCPCASSYTGLFAAAAAPELIERLVLMQATEWDQERRWLTELAKVLGMLAMGVPLVGDKVIGTPYLGQALSASTERWFPNLTTPPSVYRAGRRPELLDKFMGPHKQAFRDGACNCQVSMYQRYFVGDDADFPRPRQPALVLWANRDISHDNTFARERKGLSGVLARILSNPIRSDKHGLLKYLPHAAFREFDDTGHFLELENPAAVCGAIEEFLAA